MPISDLAQINVSLSSALALAAGFGTPLILGTHTRNTDRIRYYSSLAGLTADNFVATDPEYKLAQAIFSAPIAPSQVAIGRRTNLPTQMFALTPVPISNATYQVKVNGTLAAFTAGASPTASAINVGLKTAIDALALGLTTSDQTTFLRLTATAPGVLFTVEVMDTTKLGVAQTTTDAGVVADLQAIQLVDNSWYAILNPFHSALETTAIAAWTEAQEKLFLAETQDSAVITTVASGASDIAATLAAAKYARSPIIYHQGDGTQAMAAWGGQCLPMDPGSETWKGKTLPGVTPTTLTDTHLTNLRAKNCNFYYGVAGINMTAEGMVPGGDWIDTVRFRDWLKARMGERIVTRLANAKKIPYTDKGAVIIESEVRAQLQEGVDVGGLSDDPKPTVTVPKVASQSSSNRQARIFPGVTFSAQLAGAIHKVVVTGSVSP